MQITFRQALSLLKRQKDTTNHRSQPYILDLLHLTNNLLRPGQTLDHLLTLLPPTDGVLALLEQVVEFLRLVHLLEQLALHVFFGVPVHYSSGTLRFEVCLVRGVWN